MWNKSILIFFNFLIVSFVWSQNNYIISGFVTDTLTAEPIIHANVFCVQTQTSVRTNEEGYFSFNHKSIDLTLTLNFQAYGFYKKVISLSGTSDTTIQVKMRYSKTEELQELIVQAKQYRMDLGSIQLPMRQLKQIPMMGGEPDVIKAFQLMPGVSGGKEGTSGLYVRGGSPDQNLFLLDNAPLYYVSHIGGFMSTFDPNMISAIKLYKGNFPARFSGRLSSVVDIHMRDGNVKKHSGEIFIGLLSTKFQVDGPIGRDSSLTYLLSLRRFNIDIITRPLSKILSNGSSTAGYTFYDVNVKLVKRFKNNGKLAFTYYDGRDRIFVNSSQKLESSNTNAYKSKNNVIWGNRLASINYSKALNKCTFVNFTVATTNFRYITDLSSKYSDNGTDKLTNLNEFSFRSKVNDILFKSNFNFNVSENFKIITGMNSTVHLFTPGDIKNSAVLSSDTLIKNQIPALENNLYFEGQFKFGHKITGNFGFNTSSFSLKDTTFYSLDPRLLIAYNVNDAVSIQIGFSKLKQYLHYLSYSGAGLPSDLWVPVTKDLIPEVSNQLSAGIIFSPKYKNFPFQVVVEVFHKQMNNLLEYKEGVNLFSLAAIESKIEKSGKGKVYGFEILLQKTAGKTTGWIAYTWSKNTRTFDNINGGNAFPFKYDRTHDISIVFAHSFSKRIQLNATWVYSTGNAITLAQSKYYQIDLGNYYYNDPAQSYQLNTAEEYNGKNGYRMPDYHKLDLGVSFTKAKTRGIRIWSFGLYNVYNQQNPFMLFYKKNKQQENSLHQLTLFPIIPSVSYSFAF